MHLTVRLATGAQQRNEVARAPDKDGGEGVPLQVQQALGEGGGAHLDAPLVAAVDLEVVAVGAVQPQQPAPCRTVPRVHDSPEMPPQLLRLQSAGMTSLPVPH